MIHHFARALAVRESRAAALATQPVQQSLFWPSLPAGAGGHASTAAAPHTRSAPAAASTRQVARQSTPSVARVRRDPSDGRRALISGRFADVCAALDRMVGEFEPV